MRWSHAIGIPAHTNTDRQMGRDAYTQARKHVQCRTAAFAHDPASAHANLPSCLHELARTDAQSITSDGPVPIHSSAAACWPATLEALSTTQALRGRLRARPDDALPSDQLTACGARQLDIASIGEEHFPQRISRLAGKRGAQLVDLILHCHFIGLTYLGKCCGGRR